MRSSKGNEQPCLAFKRFRSKPFSGVPAGSVMAAFLQHRGKYLPFNHLPGERMRVFWSIAVEAGDVKEIWPNSRWLDDTFLKTQDQWRK